MRKRGIRLVALALMLLLGGPRMLADSVDDYVLQQMKEKHIPGAVLIVLENSKVLGKKRTVSQTWN